MAALTFMKRSKATDHWPWLVLLLLLVLTLVGNAWRDASTRHGSGGSKQRPASSIAGSFGVPSQVKEEATTVVEAERPKVYHTGVSARVRVRPGESAVMGYYEIEPGK